jgi:transglutaminase-like putative cysteine protease
MRAAVPEEVAEQGRWGGRAGDGNAEAEADPLPLYVASLIVSLCGIGDVTVTINEPAWSQRCIILAIIGHVVSYVMRRGRVPAQLGYLPVGILGALALIYQVISGHGDLGLSAGPLPPDMMLAIAICWLIVIRSFGLLTNGALLFSCVPTLATLGLTASANPNSEIPILFGVFLFTTIFMALFEQHLARLTAGREATNSLTWQLSTTAVIFTLAMLAGSLVGVVSARAISPLSPYALPALSRIQAKVPNFITGPQTNNGTIRVGSGPIALLPDPVFDLYTPADGGLWRAGVMEDYNAGSWYTPSTRQVPLESSQFVAAQPPPGLASDVKLPRGFYRFPIEPSLQLRYPVATRTVQQTIVVRGQMTPQLPVLDRPTELRVPERQLFFRPSDGVVQSHSYLTPGVAYQVTSEVPLFSPEELRRALPCSQARGLVRPGCFAYPATADRLRGLAQQITAGKHNDYDRVTAIIEYIEANCSYTLLEEPAPEGEDAVEYYLFTTRAGACDLAATAAVLLCRTLDIPARAVTGFVAAAPLPDGGPGYQVREMDRHMWLEVFFPGYGWVPFNPAPPSRNLDPGPVATAMHRFRQMLGFAFHGGIDTYLVMAIVLFLLGTVGRTLAAWLVGRWHTWRADRLVLAQGGPAALALVYRQMDRSLRRAGWRRDPAMTPNEYQQWLAGAWGPRSSALELVTRITQRFVRAWYGGEDYPAAYPEARRDLAALRRAIPRRSKNGED